MKAWRDIGIGTKNTAITVIILAVLWGYTLAVAWWVLTNSPATGLTPLSEQQISFVLSLFLGGGLVTLMVVALGVIAVSRSVIQPLKTLTEDVEQVAGGEYDTELLELDTKDEVGELSRSVGTMKRELLEVSAETRLFRKAVDAAGHAFYITDTQGQIEYVNPGFESITGFSADEAIGEHPRILKSGEMAESYYEELWETLQAGDVWEETVVNRRKDDELYHAHQTIAPVTDTTDEVEAYVAIQTDITERKQLEDDLQDSIGHLQVIDRVLRHNLRNDMNIIKGYAETIRDSSSGQATEYATSIVEQSEDLLDTVGKERHITDLLANPRPTKSVDLVPLVTAIVKDSQDQFPTAQISVDVPNEAIVSTTRNVGRAIRELVQNAIGHSDRDRPRVEVSVSMTEDRIALHVADDGPDIPEMERKVLSGVEDIESLYHGSGLGLWLVHLIVKESDATLAFAENEPRGSIVTIELNEASAPEAVGPPAATVGGAKNAPR